ncbi:MAG: threonine--tRNA ligase [Patescibacteria group bacterium]|nr:threonine--tRNA ligase [Patescibacteria group bacterium]
MDKPKSHQQIGQEQDLFVLSDLVGSGLPMFTPKGATVRRIIEEYMFDLLSKYGYDHVWIPHLARKELYEISGHLEKFGEDIFPEMKTKGRSYILKAMNCPHHIQIFGRKPISYKEMPQRYAETTTVYRSEQSGELGGLTRVLSITQDDAHVFCTKEQLKDEFKKAIEINKQVLKDFGFHENWIRLSLWDKGQKEKYLGDEKVWEEMQNLMREILTETKTRFKEAAGEAAFYGPKMDLMVIDSHCREWQVSTIQLDFNLPERFNISYIDEKGEKERPYMIHRATLGSVERFLGVYIEHVQGAFPLWLSPVQAAVIPVSDKFIEAAKKVFEVLKNEGIRVELNDKNDTLSAKIRDCTLQKIPYMCIIGGKEAENERLVVSVRTREGKDLGQLDVPNFLKDLKEQIDKKI